MARCLQRWLALHPSLIHLNTHQQRPFSAQLPIQPTRKGPLHRRLIRIIQADNPTETGHNTDKASQEEEPLSSGEMGVFVGGEHAQDVVIFVYGFPKVSTLLLVPPVAVGVAELALLRGWVGVTSVLYGAEGVSFECFAKRGVWIRNAPCWDLRYQLG